MTLLAMILCLLSGDTVKVHRFGYGQTTDTVKAETVIKHCFTYSVGCPEGRIGCPVLHTADSCWYEVIEVPETTLVDTIASKHRDSNDPNNLPCPKGYHGVRDGHFVIDTSPEMYCYHCVKDTLVDSALLPHPQGVYEPGALKGAKPFPPMSLVDSGGYAGVGQDTTFGIRIKPRPLLDSAELADLREMLRECPKFLREIRGLRKQMDFRTCLDTLNIQRRYRWVWINDSTCVSDTLPHRSVKDSCECVYGKGK